LKINYNFGLFDLGLLVTRISLLLVVCICLAGCGAKGALFLPSQPNSAEEKDPRQVPSSQIESSANSTKEQGSERANS